MRAVGGVRTWSVKRDRELASGERPNNYIWVMKNKKIPLSERKLSPEILKAFCKKVIEAAKKRKDKKT